MPSQVPHTVEAGRQEGHRIGLEEGRRDGACQAAASAARVWTPGARRSMSVMYVPQGFPAIDQGVQEALAMHAGSVAVSSPGTMFVDAERLRPDLVLVMNGLHHVFPADQPSQIAAIRNLGIPAAIWFADDPYFTRETSSLAFCYDYVFTHDLEAVDFYRRLGHPQVHYAPLGVNTGVYHAKPVPRKYRSDVCFIGQGFWNRIRLLDQVLPQLQGLRVVIAGGEWERLSPRARRSCRLLPGWMPIEETVNYYNGARIVLNIHRTTEPGVDNHNDHGLRGASINPRTYEISACGTLQMTDIRDDLGRYYVPGQELDTFGDAGELVGKIRHYLLHEDLRRAVSVKGMLRTLQEHTFARRVGDLLDLLPLG
ncbi:MULTISPECIES: glycosyltransferase [unclassified Paenibacillus]|uniref:CgeB family protein n=1 Tax=unclassified Paenibacillus TaxID=185978 RepID=UPI00095423BC|nr:MULTISPECIES: glycosyltransferase [unclassified Paenibacillus]ASS68979.1 glycosyltransferase [Paenibacillus sp. RUD330]SIR12360.1 spore maturation protein CgeB [Paenibacillus sp. RU4X]SIR25040.1 spore maturation protein CgeB [Paenibacillus sp. RU4T]